MRLPESKGSSWTLFLDRDGVINKKKDGYITKFDDFVFLPDVLSTLPLLSDIFERIIVVTNQQGVGKGLMTHDDLHNIHGHMLRNIELAGGHIDNIYYAPYLESENHPCRKPNPGLGIAAKSDFPSIDFSQSVMVGDSESDIEFGKVLKMTTVFISKREISANADLTCSSLYDFCRYLNL